MVDQCKLCDSVEDLQKSHSIPNAAFRDLFSKYSGKAIQLVADLHTPIKTTNESGHDLLLCVTCERKLNEGFDKPSINALRNIRGESVITRNDGCLILKVRPRTLRMFVLSIIWRASISRDSMFSRFNLEPTLSEELKTCLKNGTYTSESLFTVTIQKMTGLDVSNVPESENDAIIPPFFMDDKYIRLAFSGYLFEIYISPKNKAIKTKAHVIKRSSPNIFAPKFDVFSCPVFSRLAILNKHKSEIGLSKLKR